MDTPSNSNKSSRRIWAESENRIENATVLALCPLTIEFVFVFIIYFGRLI